MSHHKKVIIQKINDNSTSVKGTRISLPTPSPAVIQTIGTSEVILSKYLDSVERIATLEANTALEVCKRKYGTFWRLVLIMLIFVALVIGMLLGYRLNPKYGSLSFEASPIGNK